jgi:hypothetical protein
MCTSDLQGLASTCIGHISHWLLHIVTRPPALQEFGRRPQKLLLKWRLQGQGYHNHNSRASASCNMPPVVLAPYQGTVQVGDSTWGVSETRRHSQAVTHADTLLAVKSHIRQCTGLLALLPCYMQQVYGARAGRSDRKGSYHAAVAQCAITIQPHSSQPRCGHAQCTSRCQTAPVRMVDSHHANWSTARCHQLLAASSAPWHVHASMPPACRLRRHPGSTGCR